MGRKVLGIKRSVCLVHNPRNAALFEELGVDSLFVDESQAFKNLAFYTKMRNVAGIAQTESQRASDLFRKSDI